MRISSIHDKALGTLLTHTFLQMNPTPIRGLKKLLEVYREIIRKNGDYSSANLDHIFGPWKKQKGLQQIIDQISTNT